MAGDERGGAKFFDLQTTKADLKWIVAEGDKVIILRMHREAKGTNGRD